MKKRQGAPKIQDVCLTGYQSTRASQPVAKDLYADPTPIRHRRKVCYVLGQKPQEEPREIPRLFIRGLTGGSVKMDFRGVAIDLSEAAFAFWVPDESLKNLHIHRGDLAIVDPMREILHEGNLVVMELDGSMVLRRLTKKGGVWFAQTADGTKSAPVPIANLPLSGVVMGITRLFTRLKAVVYRGTRANFRGPCERVGLQGKVKFDRRKPATKRTVAQAYSKPKRKAVLLAGEEPSPYRLTELEKKPRYSARAKTR